MAVVAPGLEVQADLALSVDRPVLWVDSLALALALVVVITGQDQARL